MKKWARLSLLVLFLSISYSNASENFGYHQSRITKYHQDMPSLVSSARYKQAALLTTAAAAVIFYGYTTIKKLSTYQPSIPVSTNAMGLVAYGAHVGKIWGEVAAAQCAGYIFNKYAMRLDYWFNTSINCSWFLSHYTHFAQQDDYFNHLKAELDHLPVIRDLERRAHKIETIEMHIRLLVEDISKVIGYIQYRRDQEEMEHIFTAVRMEKVARDIQSALEQFCRDFESLLIECKHETEFQKQCQQTVNMSSEIISFERDIKLSLKTFMEYESTSLFINSEIGSRLTQ